MKDFFKLFIIAVIILFVSCKKDDKAIESVPADPGNGNLKIEFENVVDALPLVFDQNYVNPKGDTFKISKFNYFISNIVITKDDNSVFAEPESYHCLKHGTPSTCTFAISNIPGGSYKTISFMLGVDSARNRSGAQTGGLDPGNQASDMFWTWSTGYIMLKLEGTAPKSTANGKFLEYHIGGYGGVNKTQKQFTFNLSTTANVSSSASPVVRFTANVNELFKTPVLIDFVTQNSEVQAGANAKMYADNYADMFSLKYVHN